jgi:demethylmenaquinone methyltransferase/2-methoxy-6-polyprenyl-1,4-benzoquinol methylase
MLSYDKKDPKTIQSMFGSIAGNYDIANTILSFQLHKYWNAKLLKEVTKDNDPKILLDLCSGTGDIAYAFIKGAKEKKKAYLLDFCPEMLAKAEEKFARANFKSGHHLEFITADAQHLPIEDNSVDAITVAYGIRNVKDPKLCFAEAFRVLKKGGTFAILELTRPSNPLLRLGHKLYLKAFLPILGRLITSNADAYTYLSSSVSNFVSPQELIGYMQSIGFKDIKLTPLSGGIASILRGSTP